MLFSRNNGSKTKYTMPIKRQHTLFLLFIAAIALAVFAIIRNQQNELAYAQAKQIRHLSYLMQNIQLDINSHIDRHNDRNDPLQNISWDDLLNNDALYFSIRDNEIPKDHWGNHLGLKIIINAKNYIDSVSVYSIGPNNLDELGQGDDIVAPPDINQSNYSSTRPDVHQLWTELQSVYTIIGTQPYTGEEQFWNNLIRTANKTLHKHLSKHDNAPELAAELFNCFDTSQKRDDLILLTSDPQIYLITNNNLQPPNPKITNKPLSNYTQCIEAVSKTQVTQFLKSKTITRRYYELCLYFKCFLSLEQSPNIESLINKSDSLATTFKQDTKHYWQHAREFVIMAYATGQWDMIKNTHPHKLHEIYPKWHSWLKQNILSLTPDHNNHIWLKSNNKVKTISDIRTFPPPTEPFKFWGNAPIPPRDLLLQIYPKFGKI